MRGELIDDRKAVARDRRRDARNHDFGHAHLAAFVEQRWLLPEKHRHRRRVEHAHFVTERLRFIDESLRRGDCAGAGEHSELHGARGMAKSARGFQSSEDLNAKVDELGMEATAQNANGSARRWRFRSKSCLNTARLGTFTL